MRHLPLAILSLLACVPRLAAAQMVEVSFLTEQKVEGELISDDGNQIVLKQAFVGKSGKIAWAEMTYSRSDLKSVTPIADPQTQYKTRKAVAKGAADWGGLAAWCLAKGMTDHALDSARRAVELQSDQADAAKVLTTLGWVVANGAWVKEDEWLAKQGKLRYHGKIMTKADVEALKAKEAGQEAARAAKVAIVAKETQLAVMDKELARLEARPAEIKLELDKVQVGIKDLAGLKDKLAAAKKAADDAYAALQTEQGKNAANKTYNEATMKKLQTESEKTQKECNKLKHEIAGSDDALVRFNTRLAALKQEEKANEKKTADLSGKRATLKAELDDLMAKAQTSEKQPEKAPASSPH